MVYEFAISPALCTNWQDLRFFLATFGGEQGRLLSDIPRKKWMRLAHSAIRDSDNGQIMKKRLLEGIKKLARQAIYRRNSVPKPAGEDWIDHAITAHEDRPFKAIITDCYDGKEECVLRNDQEFTEHSRWKVLLDQTVERSAANIIEAIRPMLDCAREVILMDRNFNPEIYRWRPFLLELAEFLSRRNFSPSINRIHYHLGDRFSSKHMELLCKKYLSKKIPSGMSINFTIWPWNELHDRYVLTDVGGVKFGIGLDVWDGQGPEEVEISRSSEDTRQRWWKACKERKPDFICDGGG